MTELDRDIAADAAERLRSAYAFALRRYTTERSEELLQEAYQLGRTAVCAGLSLLEVAEVHHEAVKGALRRAEAPAERARIVASAGDFFREALSAYEMLSRGFQESEALARTERRHAAMLRQLSSFLADASLAVDAAASTEEILRLVAEQARDVLGASRSLASVTPPGEEAAVVVESNGPEVADEDRADEWIDGWSTLTLVAAGDPTNAIGDDREARRLTAPVAALDGTPLGALQVGRDSLGAPFTAMEEAVLTHLAEMAAAALERAWLYGSRAPTV